MLSGIDRNHCPPSIGNPVRNRRNPQEKGYISGKHAIFKGIKRRRKLPVVSLPAKAA